MDSMRSLDKSLPSSLPGSRRHDPPEQLLQAFRSAALSVTTLYKTAAADQSQARQLGYQEALDDLISFLDSERLGVASGEGWKVRQWALERSGQADTGPATSAHGDSDDEKGDGDIGRSSSPVAIVDSEGDNTLEISQETSSSILKGSASPPTVEGHSRSQPSIPNSTTFTFRSSLPLPSQRDADMNTLPTEVPPTIPPHRTSTHPNTQTSTGPATSMRVGVVPFSSRYRGANSTRLNVRSFNSHGALGAGAGYKRKIPFGEFFDITSTGTGRDVSGGGGKRGRFSREPST